MFYCKLIIFICLAVLNPAFAALQEEDTIFIYGNGVGNKWGVPLKTPDSDVSFRIGARLHSLTSHETTETDSKNETNQDFQLRRVRLQVMSELKNGWFFYMDMRNDSANQQDEGEKTFNVGDAYISIPLAEDHALRLYRAKIDMSRTQTVSSSEILFVNRPYISDEAANFISHNRRAPSAQLNGIFFDRLVYQLAVGEGVFSGKFNDAKGANLREQRGQIIGQNFMMGGRLRYSPIKSWEDVKLTETYFGKGQHFSIGAAFFNTSNIHYLDVSKVEREISRNLFNVDLSFHYRNFAVFSEYFKLDGVIDTFASGGFRKGTGEGWFVQGEYVFPDFYWLAPFFRYESWNRFIEKTNATTESQLLGVNWYLNGNRFRVSLAYEKGLLESYIRGEEQKEDVIHLATMWHF